MTNRGVALLVILWLLVALGGFAAISLVAAHDGSDTTRNRIWLRRAEWARDACGEVLLARWTKLSAISGPALRPLADRVAIDSLDLGRGTWCSARLENPAAKLNLNLADPVALRSVLGDASLTDALLDWRDADTVARPIGAEARWYRGQAWLLPRDGPLASVEELARIKGFDPPTVERASRLLTTEGSGAIDLNVAPREVMATVPGLGAEAIETIVIRRSSGRTFGSVDEVVGALSPSEQRALFAVYERFRQAAAVAPASYLAQLTGSVVGTPVTSRATLVLVPDGGRLAVIQRRAE